MFVMAFPLWVGATLLTLGALPTGLLLMVITPAAAQETRIPPSRLPSAAKARQACNYVASRGPPIALELIGSGSLDANNDGRPDDVSVGIVAGTMRGDALEFRPRGAAKDSKPIEITRPDFDRDDDWGFGARWLRYRGRTYTLNFESETLRRVQYLGYIDAQNVEHVVCRFANIEREELTPVMKTAVDLCRRVAGGQVNYTAVNEAREQQGTERRETSLKGRVSVDSRNMRRPEPLVLLSYASGAGRGCEFDYFDVISDDRLASGGETHDILMGLQAIEPSEGRSSGPCGHGAPRWFEYDGRLYLDYASAQDHGLMARFHNVKSVSDNRIELACKGEFKVKWEIKTMGPEFKAGGQ